LRHKLVVDWHCQRQAANLLIDPDKLIGIEAERCRPVDEEFFG